MQKNQPIKNLTTVSVNIQDILTSKTCAHIIIEIIKYLAYQKLQIPHTYDVLKYLVQKKRDFDKANPNQNENMQSKNHFRVASSAVDVLDAIFLVICFILGCCTNTLYLRSSTQRCEQFG